MIEQRTDAIGKMHYWPERNRIGFDEIELHDGYLHTPAKATALRLARTTISCGYATIPGRPVTRITSMTVSKDAESSPGQGPRQKRGGELISAAPPIPLDQNSPMISPLSSMSMRSAAG